jgi:AbrB family looped-hinge helix DNA binding protein
MPRISEKNQVKIPAAVLEQAGLRAGDRVVVEALAEGEVRVRRDELTFETAFGALTGAYPAGYLERLDTEDLPRLPGRPMLDVSDVSAQLAALDDERGR